MFNNKYTNFVKSSQNEVKEIYPKPNLSGEEVRRIYLEEVQEAKVPTAPANIDDQSLPFTRTRSRKRKGEQVNITDKDLFITVQCNDVHKLIDMLDSCPDKINVRDEYGWSLLMIACQANSVETVKELLNRNIDTSVRDKAGNSAHSLVIKNKNIILADLLLSCNKRTETLSIKDEEIKLKKDYVCEICSNKKFADKVEHLSSTLHNINASKGKKIPTSYVIPQTNKGYQMMLRVGWDKDSGLGPDGSGKKYPIRTLQKKDRKGLGNHKSKQSVTIPQQSCQNKSNDFHRNRNLEIRFRREFY